jgi:uncharacterized membrane protein
MATASVPEKNMRRPALIPTRSLLVVASVSLLVACSPEPTRVIELPDVQMAKAAPTTSVSVTSATPGFGKRGERLLVHVFGSGFNSTAIASWERGGVPDARINVISTSLVSSTEVVADVEIAADADLALYDVAVSVLVASDRKKGVGIEKFEVTSAMLLPELPGPGNNSLAWDLNDAGQVVGRSRGQAFFWDAATGIDNLGPGQAFDIDAAGAIVVGADESSTRKASAWTGGAHNWTANALSTACQTNIEWSQARTISANGTLIGGNINVVAARNRSKSVPVVWDGIASNCRALDLPAEYEGGAVNDVSGVGLALGGVSNASTNRAVVWDVTTGTATTLAPIPGGTWSGGQAISPNGMYAAGLSENRATFWARTETGWSVGVPLTPSCSKSFQTWARAVNDSGIIVGNSCDGGRWWQVSGTTIVASGLMPGLGPTDHPVAEGLTNNTLSGQPWAAGGGAGATYWRKP